MKFVKLKTKDNGQYKYIFVNLEKVVKIIKRDDYYHICFKIIQNNVSVLNNEENTKALSELISDGDKNVLLNKGQLEIGDLE